VKEQYKGEMANSPVGNQGRGGWRGCSGKHSGRGGRWWPESVAGGVPMGGLEMREEEGDNDVGKGE
jgi:hypothetical protein